MPTHTLYGEKGGGRPPGCPGTIFRIIGPPTAKIIYYSPQSGQTFAATG